MAGMITHSWNGTILTITSDSGTSSMDLKGGCGDLGPRGPQGPAGVIINPDGTINYNGYATEQYVEDLIAQIEIGDAALEDYYTKEETLALIPNTSNFATTTYVQTAINESLPDLSSYAKTTDLEGLATEEYVNQTVANVDVDLTGYATEEYVDNAIAGVEAGDVNLTNYYTKSEVDALIPDVSGLASEEYVQAKIAEAQLEGEDIDLSIYALKSEIPDVSDFTTMTAIEAKGYQTADQVQTAINDALAALDGDEVSY